MPHPNSPLCKVYSTRFFLFCMWPFTWENKLDGKKWNTIYVYKLRLVEADCRRKLRLTLSCLYQISVKVCKFRSINWHTEEEYILILCWSRNKYYYEFKSEVMSVRHYMCSALETSSFDSSRLKNVNEIWIRKCSWSVKTSCFVYYILLLQSGES